METQIAALKARRVWDSRGRPTLEAEVKLQNGSVGRAIAPAGASTGSGEAVDLRDGGVTFGGYDVQIMLNSVRYEIAPKLITMDATDQALIDKTLFEIDGTQNASRLGAGALVAVSMAAAHAAADASALPLWAYLSDAEVGRLPVPEIQIFGGGAHAARALDLQDLMVVPYGASSFAEALEWTAEIYLAAGAQLAASGRIRGVADEGGYWPDFSSNYEAIEALVSAIERAGFDPERQVGVSIDVAATQLFDGEAYHLRTEERSFEPDAWLEYMSGMIADFPIVLLEDPFEETDFERPADLVRRHADKTRIIGDDLTTTSAAQVERAARLGACDTLLCKPNQAGTLTRAKDAFDAARKAGWQTIVSARSGESEDVTIAHLSVAWGADFLKVGSFSRSERMAKWNEMIRIEETLGASAYYAGASALRAGAVS